MSESHKGNLAKSTKTLQLERNHCTDLPLLLLEQKRPSNKSSSSWLTRDREEPCPFGQELVHGWRQTLTKTCCCESEKAWSLLGWTPSQIPPGFPGTRKSTKSDWGRWGRVLKRWRNPSSLMGQRLQWRRGWGRSHPGGQPGWRTADSGRRRTGNPWQGANDSQSVWTESETTLTRRRDAHILSSVTDEIKLNELFTQGSKRPSYLGGAWWAPGQDPCLCYSDGILVHLAQKKNVGCLNEWFWITQGQKPLLHVNFILENKLNLIESTGKK